MSRISIATVLALAASPAFALAATVTEPDVLGLLAIGGVAGLVAWIRKRNKR